MSGPIYTFTCSIQSINKDRYEEVMGGTGAQFESVMHWMKYLAEKKAETGLQLSVSYVRTTQTDKEIEEYRDYWNNLGVFVGENKLHSRGGNLYQDVSNEKQIVKRCSLFDNRLFVAANGDVLACCQDLDGQSKLGTIGIDSLQSILVRNIARRQKGRMYPMCANCNDECAVISV